eukprot:TRINITY_DN57866_c0_g1_i1.p1 TRINITY_DN57866_c0_g1~~TRINITY_DN57866_c0_g1_i1.p1  ORF type:complete len:153 (+),score=18.72 TRINITY_DN57866_c0_g1_i1:162-620(+)
MQMAEAVDHVGADDLPVVRSNCFTAAQYDSWTSPRLKQLVLVFQADLADARATKTSWNLTSRAHKVPADQLLDQHGLMSQDKFSEDMPVQRSPCYRKDDYDAWMSPTLKQLTLDPAQRDSEYAKNTEALGKSIPGADARNWEKQRTRADSSD